MLSTLEVAERQRPLRLERCPECGSDELVTDGDSWEPLDVTKDETKFFETAGTMLRVEWDKPSDFEPSVVNGEEAFWVRCVVTAHNTPSITTAPLGTQGWLFLEKTAKASYEHIIE
jgi:hypothetical protein